MKLPFKKPDFSKPRPYWHVDAKWVCALLLIAVLAVTLPVSAAYRLTARKPATEIVAYTLAGLTSPKGLDSTEGIEDIKARVLQNGSETVTLGGVNVVFTAQDFTTLSPRELRLKVFRTYAQTFYDKGVRELAKSQGLDQAAINKAENDAFLIKNFSADAHNRIGGILCWLVVAVLLLVAALVFFSWRFGRLVSPGLVFVLVGLPGLPFALIAHQNPEVSSLASEKATDYAQAAGAFASYLAPLVMPHLAAAYLFVFVPGAALLVLAVLGKIVYALVRKHNDKGKKQGEEYAIKKDDSKKK